LIPFKGHNKTIYYNGFCVYKALGGQNNQPYTFSLGGGRRGGYCVNALTLGLYPTFKSFF